MCDISVPRRPVLRVATFASLILFGAVLLAGPRPALADGYSYFNSAPCEMLECLAPFDDTHTFTVGADTFSIAPYCVLGANQPYLCLAAIQGDLKLPLQGTAIVLMPSGPAPGGSFSIRACNNSAGCLGLTEVVVTFTPSTTSDGSVGFGRVCLAHALDLAENEPGPSPGENCV